MSVAAVRTRAVLSLSPVRLKRKVGLVVPSYGFGQETLLISNYRSRTTTLPMLSSSSIALAPPATSTVHGGSGAALQPAQSSMECAHSCYIILISHLISEEICKTQSILDDTKDDTMCQTILSSKLSAGVLGLKVGE